jgi:hypothetical protein
LQSGSRFHAFALVVDNAEYKLADCSTSFWPSRGKPLDVATAYFNVGLGGWCGRD